MFFYGDSVKVTFKIEEDNKLYVKGVLKKKTYKKELLERHDFKSVTIWKHAVGEKIRTLRRLNKTSEPWELLCLVMHEKF